VVFGILGAAAVSFLGWGVKQTLYPGRYAAIPGATYHDQIRFGPNNTNTIR
jgi:hypothetical protein